MAKRSWSDLSPRTRRLIKIVGVLEAILFLAAQVDLARRPSALVSGAKWKWHLVIAINLIGPIAYFTRGRRPKSAQ